MYWVHKLNYKNNGTQKKEKTKQNNDKHQETLGQNWVKIRILLLPSLLHSLTHLNNSSLLPTKGSSHKIYLATKIFVNSFQLVTNRFEEKKKEKKNMKPSSSSLFLCNHMGYCPSGQIECAVYCMEKISILLTFLPKSLEFGFFFS